MSQEEYINIIYNELKKTEEEKKNWHDTLNFYLPLEGMNSKRVIEANYNFQFAKQKITLLKNIVKLPVYIRIQNMTSNEIDLYKEKIIKDINTRIDDLNNKINELQTRIIEKTSLIDECYNLYKTNNDKEQINKSKIEYDNINEYKLEITNTEEKISEIKKELIKFEKLDNEQIKTMIIEKLELKNIEKELSKYKTDKTDKLIYPIIDNEEVKTEIIKLINEYNKVYNIEPNCRVQIPKIMDEFCFDDYTNNSAEWLVEYTYESSVVNDMIEVSDEYDFDLLNDVLDTKLELIVKINKKLNEQYEILNQFITYPDVKKQEVIENLSKLNKNLCNDGDVNKSISRLNNIYYNWSKKQGKKMIIPKSAIKKETPIALMQLEVKYSLDILWKMVNDNIEKSLIDFNDKDNLLWLNEVPKTTEDCYENKLIIDRKHYSEQGLYSLKLLLRKYIKLSEEIINAIEQLKNEFTKSEENLIKAKEQRDEQIRKIKNTIKDLWYSNIDPNYNSNYEYKEDIADYNKIYSILTTDRLFETKAKVEIEALIKKVKAESLIQIKYTINDLEKFKEELLSYNNSGGNHKKVLKP